jgi:hypothetical protein
MVIPKNWNFPIIFCALLMHPLLVGHGLAGTPLLETPATADQDAPDPFAQRETGKESTSETNQTSKPSVPLPAAAVEAVVKLDQSERLANQELEKAILERRKLVVAKLQAMAAKASPELRSEIEGKISRMDKLAWNVGIAHPGWSPNAALDRLMGEWFQPSGTHYIIERDGKIMSNGKQKGIWNWVDTELGIIALDTYGSEFVDLIQLVPETKDRAETINNHGHSFQLTRKYDSNIDENHYRYPLAQAAYFETKFHLAHRGKLIKEQRQAAVTLRALAQTLTGPVAAEVGALVEKITGGKHGQREKAERVAGKWKSPDGRVWEFRSDGQLYRNNERIEGRWAWAKVANWNTILVRTTTGEPGSDKVMEVFFARVAAQDPKILRVFGLGITAYDMQRQ